MEKQLFDWDGWDDLDEGVYQFYNPVTKVQIGDIPANCDLYDCAVVDYQRGILQFILNDPSEYKEFKLELKVLEEIK